MKFSVSAAVAHALLLASSTQAFSSSFTGSSTGLVQNGANVSMEYIPSGMSKEQWKKIKDAEKSKTKGKNLGATGITSFKSRSFADWQRAGGKNLFPVDPKTVKDPSQIPYMQRPGGMPDDSDLKPKKGGSMFSFGGKKKEAPKAAAPEPEKKKTNWWTLN